MVEANERGLAQVNVRFSGWIQKLFVSATGERVRRGQVLATIYSPDVLRAEQELLVTSGWKAAAPGAGGLQEHEHDHETAVAGLEANARGRLELLGISSQELDEILASGKPADAIAIRSPVERLRHRQGGAGGRRRAARDGAVRGRGPVDCLGDGRGVRARPPARAGRPAGPVRAERVSRRDAPREGAVRLPHAGSLEPRPEGQDRAPQPFRQDRAPAASRDVGDVAARRARRHGPGGSGRGDRRHRRRAVPVRVQARRSLRAAKGAARRPPGRPCRGPERAWQRARRW